MRERASDLGWKAVALVVLLIAGWILLKVVIGFLSWAFTIAIAIAAVVERVVGGQVGAAREPEHRVDALGLEALDDGVDRSH